MASHFPKYLTPLMRASAIGHVERVTDLIEADGVDVNECGPRNSTALMFAAGSGHLEVVKVLVEHGARLDMREEGGWTPLMHAQADGCQDVEEFLRRAGAAH